MVKKLHITLIALFFAIITLPAVLVLAGNDKDFSENENRMLQTAPELSLDSVLSGNFQEELTSYISDQFPARDTWTSLGTDVKKLAGFKDIGGAYLGKDGYYIEKLTPESVNEKDKYKVFFGGNYGQVVIKGGCDNGKTLLIIKDSFANSLAPFLTADYETIIMLDLRYFTGSAQSVIDENNVDDILFVQEMRSFSNDKSLIKLTF